MLSSCEVTQATCSTLLRGIWVGVEGQDFVVEVDFKLTFSFLVFEVEDYRHRFCNAEL